MTIHKELSLSNKTLCKGWIWGCKTHVQLSTRYRPSSCRSASVVTFSPEQVRTVTTLYTNTPQPQLPTCSALLIQIQNICKCCLHINRHVLGISVHIKMQLTASGEKQLLACSPTHIHCCMFLHYPRDNIFPVCTYVVLDIFTSHIKKFSPGLCINFVLFSSSLIPSAFQAWKRHTQTSQHTRAQVLLQFISKDMSTGTAQYYQVYGYATHTSTPKPQLRNLGTCKWSPGLDVYNQRRATFYLQRYHWTSEGTCVTQMTKISNSLHMQCWG